MGKRGQKPKGKVKIKWSADFAYAIGLIVTDGCLYRGRSINLTSKDLEQVNNFQKALGIKCHIGRKSGRVSGPKIYYTVQFGDVLFFNFLETIGLSAAKSKTVGIIDIPQKYFFDFLRGSFDGDGCTYSYWDPRWKSSFMFYTTFVSASEKHVLWIQSEIEKRLDIRGHITKSKTRDYYQLKYAKKDSRILIRKMYYKKDLICLSYKKLKIDQMLAIVGKSM